MVNLGETKMACRNSGPKFGLFVSTALASMALAGCTSSAPVAEASFAKAQSALEDGRVDSAVGHAETAVLAEPRNAGYRAVLGAAYMEAGRFQSAATAFGEAIELGDTDSRTVLSYSLAKVATGDNAAALSKLAEFEGVIPAADLGLALALAGQPQRGVHHLINAIRNGENTAKTRQNLAYSYALAGNWRAARVMAAEDVPADQIDQRLSDWASTASPEDYQIRVASLLGVTAINDNGQPQHLALANFPERPEIVVASDFSDAPAPISVPAAAPSESEALAFGAPETAPAVEVVDVSAPAPVETVEFVSNEVAQPVAPSESTAAPRVSNPRIANAPQRAPASNAVEQATPVSMPTMAASTSGGIARFVSNPVVQSVPAASAEARTPARTAERATATAAERAARPAPQRRMAVATGSAATHLVQLGAFSSRAVAESKWDELKRRFPELAAHDVVITEARVNGRTFFRVAAAGFGRRSAANMCNAVKSRGQGCFAYAAASPPAGAVNRGVRIAARTR